MLDGVGGWDKKGICSGVMTKELIGHLKHVYATWKIDERRRSLHSVLDQAVTYIKNKGSTTAVMAELDHTFDWNDEEVTLRTCNLGDSGYMIFRPHEKGCRMLFQTTSQQHYFNCPYQVGNHSKLPTKADSLEHQLLEKDIVVMASDGVWDNLYSTHIKACLDD